MAARKRSSNNVIRIRLKPRERERFQSRDRGFMNTLQRRAEGLADASGKTVVVMSGSREIGRATPER